VDVLPLVPLKRLNDSLYCTLTNVKVKLKVFVIIITEHFNIVIIQPIGPGLLL